MTILIGTNREQIEIQRVAWIIIDQVKLQIHTDGDQAVIEEVQSNDEDL